MSEIKQIHRILEGALFASGQPLSIDRLLMVFDEKEQPTKIEIREALLEIAQAYQDRGIELKELASGFQFQVKADLSRWVRRLFEDKTPRYSRALLETLALMAYRQPITRSEIEEIRGVTVGTNIVRTLLDHEWVHVIGYRDVPGKPAIYATTKKFLDHFGLKSLSELPTLSEIRNLEEIEKTLQGKIEEDIQAGDLSLAGTLDEADQEVVGEGLEEDLGSRIED